MPFNPEIGMRSNVEAAIFDMDGVIIDSQRIADELLISTAEQLGANLSQGEMNELIGAGSRDFWEYVIEKHNLPYTVEFCRSKFRVDDEIAAYRELGTIPGVVTFARSLAELGMPIGLATTASRKRKEAVIDMFDLQDLFVATTDEDEVTQLKPHPEVYLITASKLGVEPQNCVAIEDSPRGVKAAKSAGMLCVQYLTDERTPKSFSADLVVKDFSSLDYNSLIKLKGQN